MHIILLAGLLSLYWAGTLPAAAAPSPVTCGATLKGNRTYTLSNDLDCSNATAPITVMDRAMLNLNNRVYVGLIILDGRRTQLRDGTIQCILAGTNGGSPDEPRCVRVEGSGRHKVHNVVVRYESVVGGSGIGIWVLSDGNSFTSNTLVQTPDAGVMVLGNDNVLEENRSIQSSSGSGFHVSGDGNRIIGNYATLHHAGYSTDGHNNIFAQNVYAGGSAASVTDEGFGIAGSGNQLDRNVVTSEDYGIFVFTGPHTITNNIAIGNGIDLLDGTTECTANVWGNNVFETSNQSCIGGTSAVLVASDAVKNFSALLVRLNAWNPKRDRKDPSK